MTPPPSSTDLNGANQSEPLAVTPKQGAKSPRGKQTATRDIVAEHSRAARAQADFSHRCEALRAHLLDANFLENKGIGNQIGFFTFCYDPALEMQARTFFAALERESEAGDKPYRIVSRNLYDVFLNICEKRRILKAIPVQEAKHGTASQLKQLSKICTPAAFAEAIDYEPHERGDVLVLTGVGEVYPFLRIHTLLDNLHVRFSDIPVVIAYPGSYTGHSFSLFNSLSDGNYYRAFDLV